MTNLVIFVDDDWTHFRAACYLHCAARHALGHGRTYFGAPGALTLSTEH